MTRAKRTSPNIRRKLILDAAISLSLRIGYKSITRDEVAKVARISSPLIAFHFPRMHLLKAAVMSTAIDNEIVEIISQGLTVNDPMVSNISKELKQKVMQHMYLK